YSFQVILPCSEQSRGSKTRRSPQGMASPFQGLQRWIGASALLPSGGPGSGRPRRCAAWQGLAIPGTARLALNRFPTR
ncbi:MAG: hypothetical protein OXI88_15605, partial [Gammaproteobacteria bacterium]|nr:hypothetical protein [Gammaproteobacteria bacterium]